MERDATAVGERRKLRLLWLIDSLTLGGAEKLAASFARSFDRTGTELTVCCLKTIAGNAVEDELRRSGVDVVNLQIRNLRDLRGFARLIGLIREKRFDIVHAHLTYASSWGALASRWTGVPLVATLHVAPVRSSRWSREWIRQWLMCRLLRWWSYRTIAVSRAIANAYGDAGLLPPSKLAVIYNGVETSTPQDHQRGIVRWEQESEDRVVIAAVAVLREGKGIEILLRAMRQIVQDEPRSVLWIIGDGERRATLQELAVQLGLAGRVRWFGYRRDVERILSGADLFVQPTLMDAFPTAVLEAMAAGKAVIASAVGGVPEIIGDGESGILVEPGDAEAIVRAVRRLLHSPQERERLAEAGRRVVGERFSVRQWITQLDELYHSAAPGVR